MNDQKTTLCGDSCSAQNQSNKLICKLTAPELRERKATVLASLKRQTVEKRELENGYAIKFPGTDSVLDELTEFIKTERECDKGEAWLELTGPAGAKGFIATELGL